MCEKLEMECSYRSCNSCLCEMWSLFPAPGSVAPCLSLPTQPRSAGKRRCSYLSNCCFWHLPVACNLPCLYELLLCTCIKHGGRSEITKQHLTSSCLNNWHSFKKLGYDVCFLWLCHQWLHLANWGNFLLTVHLNFAYWLLTSESTNVHTTPQTFT